MPPIYVDFDDVLCDTAQSLLDLLKREFGKQVAYQDLVSFDLQATLGLTPREFGHFFELAHKDQEIATYAPIPEALAALRRWSQQGLKITVVTGRPPATRDASLQWLAHHRAAYDTFMMVDKYGRGHGGRNGALCLADFEKLDFAMAVEDAPQMALQLASRMQTPVALLDRPWNRRLPNQKNITRVDSWAEVHRVNHEVTQRASTPL